jgi:uncharacterized protein (DUF305 family)
LSPRSGWFPLRPASAPARARGCFRSFGCESERLARRSRIGLRAPLRAHTNSHFEGKTKTMKTKTWPALLAALAVIALAAVTAGCGGDDQPSTSSGNPTDAAFITDMTAHHEGAIEMARIAQQRAEHPEIRRLADDIMAAQESEISVMKTIRRDMDHMGENGGGHMGMSDSEMGMSMNPAALETAEPFDRAFIDAMVPHHQGAVAMAKQLLKQGEQPALRKMGDDIIAAQTKEIAQMRKWRKAWYGSAGSSDASTHGSGDGMGMGG